MSILRARVRHTIATALVGVALTINVAGCLTFQSYPLSVSGAEGPRYFAPITACAGQAGLEVSTHPTSVNVRFEQTWVQFMVQGAAFNMVILVDSSVPEEKHADQIRAAKSKGDAIFACAIKAGPSDAPLAPATMAAETAPPAPEVLATSTAEPPTAPASAAPASAAPASAAPDIAVLPPAHCPKSTKACSRQSDCGIEHCSEGFCYPPNDGCPCSHSTHCGPDLHCGAGRCYPSKAGTPCDGTDSGQCGTGLHCTKGLCRTGEAGSLCDFRTQCKNGGCVNGVCN